MTAKLYVFLVTRLDKDGPLYDCCNGAVVIAKSAEVARSMIVPGDEGAALWKDPARSSVLRVGAAFTRQRAGVICRDFHAG